LVRDASSKRIIIGPRKMGTIFIGNELSAWLLISFPTMFSPRDVRIPERLDATRQPSEKICQGPKPRLGCPSREIRKIAAGIADSPAMMSEMPVSHANSAGRRPCWNFHNRKVPPMTLGASRTVVSFRGRSLTKLLKAGQPA